MELVREFRKLNRNDVAIAGGKGASLGEMTRAGIPVPPGFVILSNAFERFIEEAELKADIDAALHKVNHEEIHTVEKASETIQALILEEEMPKDIALEIKKHFKKLGATWVAVRSSATAEDSSTAAWAGQLESYLNTTKKDLLENVKRCWASLFTPRAIFYRFEKGLHGTPISVAVVVQKMVESEVSGIAFSVHPVTQDYNQLIIEAGFGLGEAIVSGSVTPDNYVVEKNLWELLDKHISTQNKALVKGKNGGNEWIDLSEEKGSRQVLTEKEIIGLAKLVVKIENHYGFPVDVEWARKKNTFYIVQSRPITTLSDKQSSAKSDSSDDVSRVISQYGVKGPFIHKGFHARFFPIDFVQMIWNKWGDYSGFYYKLHISILHNDYWDLYYFPSEFTKLREHFLHRAKKEKGFLARFYRDWTKSCIQLGVNIESFEKATVTNDFSRILKAYNALVQEYLFEYALAAPIQEASGFQPEQWIIPKIEEFSHRYKLDYNQTAALLISPIVHSFITQEEIELLKIALKGKKSKSIEKDLQKHQTRWFWIQNNYAKIQELPLDFFKKRLAELEKHPVQQLQSKFRALQKAPADLKKQKKKLFHNYQPSKELAEFVKLNELFAEMQDVRKAFVLHANHCHKLFLEAVAKKFKQPLESLWFYLYNEMLQAIQTGTFLSVEEIQRRKEIMVAVQSKTEKIVFSGKQATSFHAHLEEMVENVQEFSGIVAQPGKVTGKVRIVLKTHDILAFEEGEIIVSSMTRPEMTLAMQKAAAFITDEGGITSHAAIIARELKKPCIIGTKIATKILKNGDWVEVDANQGIVKILEKKSVN